MGFSEHSQLESSEKIILAHIEPSQRLAGNWVQDGADYYITAPHFVIGVAQDGVELTSGWSFDASNYRLTITTATDPNEVFTNVTYRVFFSNLYRSLPYDLSSGVLVPYLPIIKASSFGGASFDKNDIAGISLEGKGSITLMDDEFWVENFDGLSWQNKDCRLYSWGQGETVKLFSGVISKADKNVDVKFTLSNFLYKFRSEVSIPVYTSSDGDLGSAVLGKPKRRIYGRVDGLYPVPLDQVLDSYNPNTITDDKRSGTSITVSGSSADTVLIASSSDIATEIVSGDTLRISEVDYLVKSLARYDFGLSGSSSITYTISGTTCTVSFSSIDTSNMTVGDFVTISPLKRGSSTLNAALSGIWTISSISSGVSFTFTINAGGSTATVDTDDEELILTLDSDLTKVYLESALEATLTSATVGVTPEHGYRRLNRKHNIAHHALHHVTSTINAVFSLKYLRLDSVVGLEVGDQLTLIRAADGAEYTKEIESITPTTNEILLVASYPVAPTVSDTVTRYPVQSVYNKQNKLTQAAEYTAETVSGGSNVILTPTAERDIVTSFSVGNLRWANNCRAVLGGSSAVQRLKPRDWIKPTGENTWYEVSEVVSSTIVILTTPYSGVSELKASQARIPDHITDVSKLWVDTYGKTDDGLTTGSLVKTGADVIEDLLKEIGLTDDINASSFSSSSIIAPYLVSMSLPETRLGKLPTVRDVANNINTGILANLYYNNSFEILHTPLSSSRLKANSTYIDDSEVFGRPALKSDSTKIYKTIIVNYSHKDLDLVTEEPTLDSLSFDSNYVDYSNTSDSILTKDVYVFNERDAQILAEKRLFISERAKSIIKLKTPLNFYDLNLNDVVVYESDYIFERASTGDKSRVGKVSSIKKNGSQVAISLDDIGDTFTRDCLISLDTSNDFASSTTDDKRFTGYITSDNGLISNDATTINNNLIS